MIITKKAKKECQEKERRENEQEKGVRRVMQEKGEYSKSETGTRRKSKGEQEGSLSCRSDALVLQASFHRSSDGP